MHGGSRRGSHSQAKASQAKSGQSKGRPDQGGATLKQARLRPAGRGAEPRTAPHGPPPDSDRLTRLLEPVVHAMNMDLEGIRVTSAGRRGYSASSSTPMAE